jgi:hypothetical protein
MPAKANERMAGSRPAPGPLRNTSTERRPCSIAFFAAATLEGQVASRRPRDHFARRVRDRNDRVAETGLNKALPVGNAFSNFFLSTSLLTSHGLYCLLLVRDRFTRTLTCTSILTSALATNWQTFAVAETAVATEIHQTLNRETDLTTEVTLCLQVRFHVFTDFSDLWVSQIVSAELLREVRELNDIFCLSFTNTVNVLERDFDALVSWKIDAGDTSHDLSLPLLVLSSFANNADDAFALDDFAFVADALHRSSHFHTVSRSTNSIPKKSWPKHQHFDLVHSQKNERRIF